MEMLGGNERLDISKCGSGWADIVKNLWTEKDPWEVTGSFFDLQAGARLPRAVTQVCYDRTTMRYVHVRS